MHDLRRAGRGSAACDGDLETRGVELDPRVLVGCLLHTILISNRLRSYNYGPKASLTSVKSSQLVADNVVPGSQSGGDLEGVGTVFYERIRSPSTVRKLPGMRNLEPDSGSAWVVGCAAAGALGHVGHVWAVVAVGPSRPMKRDGRAGGHGGAQGSGSRSTVQIAIALEINRLHILDGPIAGYLADDSLGRRVVVGIRISEAQKSDTCSYSSYKTPVYMDFNI